MAQTGILTSVRCRSREGFWVDVEAGKTPTVTRLPESSSGKYGTFAVPSGKNQGRLVLWAAVVGGSIMVLLSFWVLFLHIYRAGD